MSKYSQALATYSGKELPKNLVSAEGALGWVVSKSPAVLGGHIADWVTEWAIARWPANKRGPKFVGGVATVLAAFGMCVATDKFSPANARLMDKLTDGMIGRISPSITGLLTSWWSGKKSPAPPPADPANASVDGDRTAIMDVAGLLHASPDTLSLMADQMFGIMKKDGVDIDAAGRESVITSMREAAGQLAGGRF